MGVGVTPCVTPTPWQICPQSGSSESRLWSGGCRGNTGKLTPGCQVGGAHCHLQGDRAAAGLCVVGCLCVLQGWLQTWPTSQTSQRWGGMGGTAARMGWGDNISWWHHTGQDRNQLGACPTNNFCQHISISVKIPFYPHSNFNMVITTKFCTWHDSTAVVACTKFGSDLIASNGITIT